jgi:hypothetical protein
MSEQPWAPGTRVEKTLSKPDDGHPDGARATVLWSLGPLHKDAGEFPAGTYGYFVRWDDFPDPVFVVGTRIRPVA